MRYTTTSGALHSHLIVALATFIACTSCTNGSTNQQDSILDRVRATRVIRAGYFVSRPLSEIKPGTDTPQGFGIDILREIAERAGASLTLSPVSFSTMLAALSSGTFDIIAVPVTESPQRALRALFTDPVFYSGLSYICRNDDTRFQSEADLLREGVRIAVTGGASSQEYASLYLRDTNVTVLTGVETSRTLLEVVAGRVDAALSTVASCEHFAFAHPEVRQVCADSPFYVCPTGFIIPPGEHDWRAFLNSGIRHLKASGFIDKLSRKYDPAGKYWMLAK